LKCRISTKTWIIKKLSEKQIATRASNEIIKYFNRVINKMDIVFSNEEYTVLILGVRDRALLINVSSETNRCSNVDVIQERNIFTTLLHLLVSLDTYIS
jgi:hypothetical protein